MAEVTGWKELASALDAMAARVAATAREIVEEGAELTVEAIKAHMGGPPGPRADSDHLRDSVIVFGVEAETAGRVTASLGPTEPYSRRIGIGFHGVDRLGRIYAQDGHPFMGPGLRDARTVYTALAQRKWAEALTP